MCDEIGQLHLSLCNAFDRERRASICLRILKVESNAIVIQQRIGKATEARRDGQCGHLLRSRQVEAMGPLLFIRCALQASEILLPDRMSRIEVTTETKADIQVGVRKE